MAIIPEGCGGTDPRHMATDADVIVENATVTIGAAVARLLGEMMRNAEAGPIRADSTFTFWVNDDGQRTM